MSLDRVRKIALGFPEAVETESFGQPWFRAGGKMFTVYAKDSAGWTLCFKCGTLQMGVFLEDPRFTKTHYVGRYGWVTLRINEGEKPNWAEITELMKMSYRNNVPARLAKKLV
jgi:hypothetical protein